MKIKNFIKSVILSIVGCQSIDSTNKLFIPKTKK